MNFANGLGFVKIYSRKLSKVWAHTEWLPLEQALWNKGLLLLSGLYYAIIFDRIVDLSIVEDHHV